LKRENLFKFTKQGYDNVYRLRTTLLNNENLKRQIINSLLTKDARSWRELQFKYFSFYDFNIYNSVPTYIDGPNKELRTVFWWYWNWRKPTQYPDSWSNVVRSRYYLSKDPGYNLSFGVTYEHDYIKNNTDIAIITYSNITGFVEGTDLFNDYYVDRTDFTDWTKLSDMYKVKFGDDLSKLSTIQSLSALMFSTKLPRQDLNNVVANKYLGPIFDTDDQSIVDAINNANPNAQLTLDDIDIFDKTSSSAIISSKPDSLFYWSNWFTVRYTFCQNLDDVINNTELGSLPDAKPQTIFDAIKKANPDTTKNLNINDINIWSISPQDGSALITSKNDKFSGQVNVTFTSSFLKDLKKVIKITNLGEIEQNDPTTILAAINSKNPNINLQDTDVTISEITAKSAKITANRDTKFIGEVIVNFK
ncbi:hypothetical protein, partial [Mycoplasma yeatsii]|uniref:hypothetical protein n=1 Tax=Mycoplasma yeatsii TaxID=51365 RepID=UPI00055B8357